MPRIARLNPKWDAVRARWTLTIPPKHSPTGKRRREFFDEKRKAQDRAEEIRDTEELSRRVVVAAGPALIKTAVNYDEIFRGIYGFEGGLEEACQALIGRLDRETRDLHFGDLVSSYEETHFSGWTEAYQAKWRWITGVLAPLIFKSTCAMDGQFWSTWLSSTCEAKGWSAGTYNDLLTMVRSIWKHSLGKDLVLRNPLEGIRKRSVATEAKSVYTVDEVRRILECAWEHDREMVPFFAIAMFAGLRPDDGSEIGQLSWGDVNFEDKWIRVGGDFKNKTKTKRFVPMEENLCLWLAPWKGKTGPVVPANLTKRRQWILRGKHTSGANLPESKWVEIAPSGAAYRDATRHTYGSYLEAKYRDRTMVMTNMGHTSPKTYQQHYHNARTPQEAEAFWSIVPPSA
jgi:integrase